MPLEAGSRLGPYEVEASIGGGGMGEVYRAKDTRIDRTVAIKVVATDMAGDSGFKERFEREARAVSSLNHPHICTLYEFDSRDGVDYLVMEHLEGETLAKRLERGPLTQDEALRYGIQIADGLDKAHRQGIVHRDLKPGNIMLTPSGAKLLDFGLAKLDPAKKNVATSELSALPTQGQPLTREGAILGTFQYMPPEQLEGREADARTDIFAFGAILYEMLTGKKAFEGKSQAGLIGAILEREPTPISSVRPATPPALERVVNKCLAKNPDDRWATAHDLMDELRWIRESTPETFPSAPRRSISVWAVMAVALVAVASGAAVLSWTTTRPPERKQVLRFPIILPNHPTDGTFGSMGVAISPDGSKIAYATRDGLYLRRMDTMSAQLVLESGNDPRSPAFSPDGDWVAFWSEGAIKKASVNGGAPLTIGSSATSFGMSWGPDDTIRLSRFFGGIEQLPANGGALEAITDLEPGERVAGAPQILPDGESVLFALRDNANWAVMIARDGERHSIVEEAMSAIATKSGHLVYWAEPGDLHAVPFDATLGEVTGDAVSVVQNVDPWNFALSDSGTLVYRPATTAVHAARLVWVDREGRKTPAHTDVQEFARPRLSPDGTRVAVGIFPALTPSDIWIYDLIRGTRTRLTTSGSFDMDAIWTPDGSTIVFASNRSGSGNLYRKASDGSADAEPFFTTEFTTEAHSFSPDGNVLAYYERGRGSDRDRDIWTMSFDGGDDPRPFVATPFNERSPSFSPNGRYIAYVSDESGRDEIYVQPYPGPGRRVVVSRDGGREPVWSHDGTELFYRRGNEIWAAPVSASDTFEVETPQKLFEGRFVAERPASGSQTYDVAADGRFILVEPTDQSSELHVVVNWFQELEERVPTGQ